MGRGAAVALLIDTSAAYAHIDASDRHHPACADLLDSHPGPLLIPQLAVTEIAYLAATRIGTEAEMRFLQDLATGVFTTAAVAPADWLRIAELVWRYRDMRLGTVDASAVALAERLGITEVATLDRRHFGAVRPSHAEAFELLP